MSCRRERALAQRPSGIETCRPSVRAPPRSLGPRACLSLALRELSPMTQRLYEQSPGCMDIRPLDSL